MKEIVDAAKDFLRLILETEALTFPGRVNAIVVVLGFLVVVAAGAFDGLQALVRIWRPNYTTGLPNIIVLFALWGAMGLFCVFIVVRLGGRPRR